MSESRKILKNPEEEYFRRQDAEILARQREERLQKHRRQEAESHKKHCTGCGCETVEVTEFFRKEFDEEHRILWTGVQICLECNQVAFPMTNLQRLVQSRDCKLQVLDLRLNAEEAIKAKERQTKRSA